MKLLRSLSVKYIVAPIVALVLAGCGDRQELYSKLTERQANEMVAALLAAGIDAEKKAADSGFAVLADRKNFSAAVAALNERGLPREQFDSLGKIFKREGFVSSPTEERARMLHALSQELSNTIANIDGVITARVHLAMPEKNPLADKVKPSGASIFIKHRAGVDLTGQVSSIKALVVNSIEGLPYDNVTVALFAAEAAPAAGASKPAPAATRIRQVSAAGPAPVAPVAASASLVPYLGAGGIALIGVSGGFFWVRRRSEKTLADKDFKAALERAGRK